ncbi:MAG: hypothetical protein PW843_09150 [Azospirillaceae bacterium]|nr:hypothetical protein [Azospirillaceae bacterium]
MSFKKIALACLVLAGVGFYAAGHHAAQRQVAVASLPENCGACQPW